MINIRKTHSEMILVQKGTESDLINYLNAMPSLLALTYPGPNEQDYNVFSEFFESPFRTERRMCSFKGCLAIDLSSYIKDVESSHLEELASYIKSNSDASYILYAIVDSMSQGVQLIRRMSTLTECKELCYRNKTVTAIEHSKTIRKKYGY